MKHYEIKHKALIKAWSMINYTKAIRNRYGELFLPVEVDGHTIYVKLSLKCMRWHETNFSKPFDPFAIDDYKEAILDKRIAEANGMIRFRKKHPELYDN